MKLRTKDALRLGCNVLIEVRDAVTGEVLRTEQQHNLITLAGRNLIRDALNGTAGNFAQSHFAVGTGTTAPTANDTTLQVERFRDVITKRTPDVGKVTFQYYLGSTSANGYTLTEAGILNALIGGTLFARVTHNPIVKTASITVNYTWVFNINAA